MAPFRKQPDPSAEGRQPLSEIIGGANNQATTPARKIGRELPSSPLLAHHHQSLKPNGLLQNVGTSNTPENKRISAVVQGDRITAKRDSQSSATSSIVPVPRSPRKLKRLVGPWLLGMTIGEGATGSVRKAKHIITDRPAAIKIVSKQTAITQRSQSVREMDVITGAKRCSPGNRPLPFGINREMVIMKMIEHPNIVKLYDVWENRGELYLVLEYVEGGELFSYISKGPLSESEAIRVFRQIISAVGYCHEFNLCHRDIKPENILIDKNGNAKIVDFGMASLQHTEWLSTSCGSPHYAAPEIALGQQYRGDKADIWSCGIVLYAMLTGTLPFGMKHQAAKKLHDILAEVVRGDFSIPVHVSDEAEDLLLRMLQHCPEDRIDIADIWQHPVVLKYEEYSRSGQPEGSWLGGPAPLMTASDCCEMISRREDIEKDILDNLCVLWYSSSEEEIVEALMSSEPNHIKVIYRNLQKSRTEQEENYYAPTMRFSTSDYHHIGKPRPTVRRTTSRMSLLGPVPPRAASNYSIAADNARRPSTQSRRVPSEADTDQSYDPFRVSRHQMHNVEADHAKVTLLPRSPAASKNTRHPSVANSVQHPAVARLQDDEAFSFTSSPPRLPVDAQGNARELRRKTMPRTFSKSSMTSSVRSRASSKAFSKSASYKRNIRFDHSRRSSTSQRSPPPPRPAAPTPLNLKQRYIEDRTSTSLRSLSPVATPSSDYRPTQFVRSRKEGASAPLETTRAAKRASNLWEETTRQVSKELSIFCDQAFNKGGQTSDSFILDEEDDQITALPQPPKTSPIGPSGMSNGRSSSFLYRSRPLPKIPVNEPMAINTHFELAKAKEKLVQRAKCLEHGELDEIIGHIDRLIEANSSYLNQQETDKRVTSAPTAKPSLLRWLSPVQEEMENFRRRNARTSRYVSEPVNIDDLSHQDPGAAWERDGTTIRLSEKIEPNDIPTPLVVRKKNSAVTLRSFHRLKPQKSEDSFLGSRFRGNAPKPNLDTNVRPPPWTGPQSRGRSPGLGLLDFQLEAIGEDEDLEEQETKGNKRGSGDSKVRNWFRRSSGSQKTVEEGEKAPIPPAKDEWLTRRNISRPETPLNPGTHSDTTSDDMPMRASKKEKPSGANRFLSMFTKKNSKGKKPLDMAVLGNDRDEEESCSPSSSVSQSPHLSEDMPSRSAVNLASSKHARFGELPASRAIAAPMQNWFARILHVKPGKKLLALQVSKVVAMKEIKAVLVDWKAYGMRGIRTDRAAGVIRGRVGENNSLHIKPVYIVIEFFTVMHKGRRAGLSVARFSQEKGAKSSFEKFVQTMEDVLRGRMMLVPEKKKAQEMKRCLAAWESG